MFRMFRSMLTNCFKCFETSICEKMFRFICFETLEVDVSNVSKHQKVYPFTSLVLHHMKVKII